MKQLWIAACLSAATFSCYAATCGTEPLQVQILGSGAGQLGEGRAAPSALLWVEGKPRLLIDVGPGSAMRFVRAGANLGELDAILLTHLHANRTADIPALVQLAATPPRSRPLPIYGPNGNRWTPSTVSFVRSLFDPARGAWRHLGSLLSPLERSPYKLEPRDVRPPAAKLGVARENREPIPILANEHLRVTALPLNFNQTAALAWRIESGGKRIVMHAIPGVAQNASENFARGADLLIAPQTLEDKASAEATAPAALGRFAHAAGVKTVALMARGRETLGQESEVMSQVRRSYEGALMFADDLDCLTP
jgi:ribonuclease BN (tRNA processing enzyme)